MATTHVFIVNDRTFPVHLEYMFAGTSAGASKSNHARLLSDMVRVRAGDPVIFYVLQVGFCGMFAIEDVKPLVVHEPNDPGYLQEELGIRLIYRTRIRPTAVFSKPVSEWDALDKLPVYAQEVLWSLIYRKLKGERGCTPVLPHEADRLMRLIKEANPEGPLRVRDGSGLTWDSGAKVIMIGPSREYAGPKLAPPDTLEEVVRKARKNTAHEAQLETFFSQWTGIRPELTAICGDPRQMVWLGNQVFCGVGMQKIDIFVVLEDDRRNREFRVIELKDEPLALGAYRQLWRYVEWTKSYVPGAINSNVQPVIVTCHSDSRAFDRAAVEELNALNSEKIAKVVKFFEYDIRDNQIAFNEVDYS